MADEKPVADEKSVYDVSRQSFDIDAHRKAAEKLGIAAEPTKLELKNDKGAVVKTIEFVKVLFEQPTGPEDTPADRFERLAKFFEVLQPPVLDKDEKVTRENNPLDILAAHLTNSMDLTMRNGIRSREKSILEGPDKAIGKAAAQLAAHVGITPEAALQRIKVAWGVE